MDAAKVVRQLLLERDMQVMELAEQMELQPQSLRNKLNRNAFSVNAFEKMLDLLDCHLEVVTNDTGKVYR